MRRLLSCFEGLAWMLWAAWLLAYLEGTPILGADYFVRAEGDDANSGLRTNAAWRTIERVNQARFGAGDRVLFEAGTAFRGNLRLSSENGDGPLVVGSHGEGRAIILAGLTNAITVENRGGMVLENLEVVGAGRTNNTGHGIFCDNTRTNGQRLQHLTIRNIEVRGFGVLGIFISGQEAGFEHVRVTRCVMRDNLRGGMEVAGRLAWNSPRYAHADVQVSHCDAYDNTGGPAYLKSHSGSGIVLYQVDGGTMEYCKAWNNGASGSGGVGLWTCASCRVTIQYCESFDNKTTGGDGGGFDIDGGSVECVLQYNYSHDNAGPGLMVYTYPWVSHADRNNVVRFNISDNDSRASRRYAGLWVSSAGPPMTGVEIYNNTVRVGPWTDHAAYVQGTGIQAHLRNNIFVAAAPAVPLRVEQSEKALRFENNLYWSEGAPVPVVWNQQAFTNLVQWRESTGQEQFHGKPQGHFADPSLGKAAQNLSGTRSDSIANLFRPPAGSPACAGGLDLRPSVGLESGCCDFSGRKLPDSGAFFLGAVQSENR